MRVSLYCNSKRSTAAGTGAASALNSCGAPCRQSSAGASHTQKNKKICANARSLELRSPVVGGHGFPGSVTSSAVVYHFCIWTGVSARQAILVTLVYVRSPPAQSVMTKRRRMWTAIISPSAPRNSALSLDFIVPVDRGSDQLSTRSADALGTKMTNYQRSLH